MRTRIPAAALALWLLGGGIAQAQTDFTALRLKPGDVAYVTPPSGPGVSGRVTLVSPSVITVDGVEFKPEPGLKIQRRGDAVWDGAVKGALLGLVLAVVVAGGECEVQSSFRTCVASAAAWIGGVGALIDAFHVGRTTIYLGTSSSTPPAAQRAVRGTRAGPVLRLQLAVWGRPPASRVSRRVG